MHMGIPMKDGGMNTYLVSSPSQISLTERGLLFKDINPQGQKTGSDKDVNQIMKAGCLMHVEWLNRPEKGEFWTSTEDSWKTSQFTFQIPSKAYWWKVELRMRWGWKEKTVIIFLPPQKTEGSFLQRVKQYLDWGTPSTTLCGRADLKMRSDTQYCNPLLPSPTSPRRHQQ